MGPLSFVLSCTSLWPCSRFSTIASVFHSQINGFFQLDFGECYLNRQFFIIFPINEKEGGFQWKRMWISMKKKVDFLVEKKYSPWFNWTFCFSSLVKSILKIVFQRNSLNFSLEIQRILSSRNPLDISVYFLTTSTDPSAFPSIHPCRVPVFAHIPSTTYQFYADWCIQGCLSAAFYTILVTSVGFYINICLYIDVMIKDLRGMLIQMNEDLQMDNYEVDRFRRSFTEELVFHNKILE